MKTLKLDHQLALDVLGGKKTSTWRINDEKNLTVNDEVELIDKVDPGKHDTWRVIGKATITRIVQKRLGDVTLVDMEGHESFASVDEMVKNYQKYYGPDVSVHTPVKMIHFEFMPYAESMAAEMPMTGARHIKLFADGGSRGNPGPSASGYVLLDMKDNVIKKSGVFLGITTNNQAEYQALRFGLEEAYRVGAREIDVFMDSLLVINQMKGIFKVKNRELWPIHQSVQDQAKLFRSVKYTHVPREFNKLADAEVNEVLDAEDASKRV